MFKGKTGTILKKGMIVHAGIYQTSIRYLIEKEKKINMFIPVQCFPH
jgi:hypothetical protein